MPFEFYPRIRCCKPRANFCVVAVSEPGPSRRFGVQSPVISAREDKSAYYAPAEGWYFGPGCFYANEKLHTVNIKIKKGKDLHLIRTVN